MKKDFPSLFNFDSLGCIQAPSEAIYTHPNDVASDPRLTKAEKRALLASWVSDARAVENAPRLRRLDSGAVVDVDTILRVLRSLDASAPTGKDESGRRLPSAGRRRIVSRWLGRVTRNGVRDDDDDPPPAPAGIAAPFRPVLVEAHGAYLRRLRDMTCAA